MNNNYSPRRQMVIERELPKVQPNFLSFECIAGPHTAQILHRGTAYCRTCFDEKNRLGQLVDY